MPKAIGQITIRDENDITVGVIAPLNPIKDEMWLDTSVNPSKLRRYNGSKWDIVNDYTGVIEDVEEKIQANTTKITVAQGQISGLISESTIVLSDINTIKNNYTSLNATVDGINSTVASHTTSISNLDSKVTTVEGKQSSLEQNLNGFKTTVSNTYSTKTEYNAINGTVTSIQQRVEVRSRQNK